MSVDSTALERSALERKDRDAALPAFRRALAPNPVHLRGARERVEELHPHEVVVGPAVTGRHDALVAEPDLDPGPVDLRLRGDVEHRTLGEIAERRLHRLVEPGAGGRVT